MYYPLSLFIALRYVYGKHSDRFGRFISRLSMIGITLGAIGLILVLSVMNGLEKGMQDGILGFMPQAQITTKKNSIDPQIYPQTDFLTLENVTNITPLVTGEIILQSPKNITVTTLLGIDPELNDEPIKPYMFYGNPTDLKAGQYGIIISTTLARELNVEINDQIRLISTNASQVTPVGRIPSQRLFTVVGLFSVNRDINQSLVYVNQKDAARLMRYPENHITSWRLFLDKPLEIDSITQQKLPEGLKFKDWREQRGELFQSIKLEKNMMGLLVSLISIVAALNIITSLGLLVMEKHGEIAILKTQGLTSRRIMTIFLIQGASSGIIGTVIGTILGLVLTLNIETITQYLGVLRLPFLIEATQVATIAISLIVVSLLSALYPAWRASKTHPAEALRYE